MTHTETITACLGRTIKIYRNRRVKITGYGPTGSAACEAVDGGEPIYSVSTAFLSADLQREKDYVDNVVDR